MFASHTCLVQRLEPCWLQFFINHYRSPVVIEKEILESSRVTICFFCFFWNCRATLRASIPCAGIPPASTWCLSAKTRWRCGLWTTRASWMSLAAAGESSVRALSILRTHPCLSLAVTRQVTYPCLAQFPWLIATASFSTRSIHLGDVSYSWVCNEWWCSLWSCGTCPRTGAWPLQRTTASSRPWHRRAPAWLLRLAMTSMSSCGDELCLSCPGMAC